MKNNLEGEYFEILIAPQNFYEIFLDFIAEQVENSLEEISTPYCFKGYENDLSGYDLTQFFPQEAQQYAQILIRTQKDPQDILALLIDFSNALSVRTQEKAEFAFGSKICQNKDWIRAYEQSILPVCVGQFYIRPSWHASAKEKNLSLHDVCINPALAFGSGHHATTSMCLELLGEMELQDKRLLDVGCGSGILGICASILGANVEICDTDTLALEESKKNFALNAQNFAQGWVGSITQAKGEYDLIVANILAHILILLEDDFFAHTSLHGTLILSGILEDYQEEVLRKFGRWQVEKILQKDQWVTLKLAKVK